MKRVAAAVALLLALPLSPGLSPATLVSTESVGFTVTNPLDPGATYTVKGSLTRPAGCASSVLLAEHGLSYGKWAWDFPLRPETYSTARALAARGYALLAIDELGYGESDHPNGYTLTVESYADITAQIIRRLRAGTYEAASPVAFSHVGLLGHSAGSEIVELAAGLYPDLVDVVIPTAYEHAPTGVSPEWLALKWIAGDEVRAAQSDYEYFETDPETRAADMYNLAVAEGDVVAKDTELLNLTPSGEIFSIGAQPSRHVMAAITAPVLLVLAEKDALFPASGADAEMLQFAGTADKALYVVPAAGHSFMLHPNAPQTNEAIADWLDLHPAQMPGCLAVGSARFGTAGAAL